MSTAELFGIGTDLFGGVGEAFGGTGVVVPTLPPGLVVSMDPAQPSTSPGIWFNPLVLMPALARPGRHVRNLIADFLPIGLMEFEWDTSVADPNSATLAIFQNLDIAQLTRSLGPQDTIVYPRLFSVSTPTNSPYLTTEGVYPSAALLPSHKYAAAVSVFNGSSSSETYSVEVLLPDGETFTSSLLIPSQQSEQLISPQFKAPPPSQQSTPYGNAVFSTCNVRVTFVGTMSPGQSFAIDSPILADTSEVFFMKRHLRPDYSLSRSGAARVTLSNNTGQTVNRVGVMCVPEEPGISPWLEATVDPLIHVWRSIFPAGLQIVYNGFVQGASAAFFVRAVADENARQGNHDLSLELAFG